MARWRDNPADVRPMLASLDSPPIIGHGLIYEPKYDGIRAIVDVRPATRPGAKPLVALYSRNGREKHAQFPEIVDALQQVTRRLDRPIVLDGEIVAVSPKGRPLGFQHIQGRIHLIGPSEIADAAAAHPAAIVVFDLLRDGDEDLRGEPMAARRLRLQRVIRASTDRGAVRLSDVALDDGRAMLSRAREEGWEGLIVKDGQAVYSSGRRTPAWRKLKLLKQQELVIGGWTEPRQSRQHFGALLVGYYEGARLRWSGSVGTGFDQAELDRLGAMFRRRAIAKSPFADVVKTQEIAHWVRPDLVAEVRFTEWTSEGLLRQPVYLGLRADKRAADVVREDPVARNSSSSPAPTSSPRRSRRRRSARPSGPDPTIEDVVAQLQELEDTKKDGYVDLPDGDTVHVTNLAKVFWPALGITKGELLRYYVQVSPLILPVVDDRPLVMKRFPNGVAKQAFYQQRHPEATPPGVRRVVLPDDVEPIDEEGPRDRLVGGSLTTLLYMTQLAAISQDPWFSRVADPLHQDFAAIDLDPGDDVRFDTIVEVARSVKEELDRLDIPAVPKTSGSRGLHIYIPLPPKTTYETGQVLCQIIATTVASKHPRIATVERMVKKRPKGTVSIDYLQNILGKTLACAYSARASDYAGVSTPLKWSEIRKGLDPRAFNVRTAPARFAKVGDLWAPLREGPKVDLKAVLKRSSKFEVRSSKREHGT
jgi:bifunctional non-homologous end joining protein LigD